MNIAIVPKSEIESVRIDKDQDIIPITVGLYRLFMASGAAGREAKDLYEHLIFTARLQETQQVKANNVYLSRGLSWGIAKVKTAKSWLVSAGLIEYVRSRNDNGLLGEVYIRLSYLPRAVTIAARMQVEEKDEPAKEDEYKDDLTPDLFYTDESTTGSEIEPLVTTGSIIQRVDNHAHGAKQQMLKVNNEMLKVKKEKEEGPPEIVEKNERTDDMPHFEIAKAWYKRYSKETAMMISPRSDDYRVAAELYAALNSDLSGLAIAINAYFGRFKELDLWYAAKKSSRIGESAAWIPDWSFRGFIAHYHEILSASMTADTNHVKLPKTIESAIKCPVCGNSITGTMATCGICGMIAADSNDNAKIEEHRQWYEDWKLGRSGPVSMMSMFRDKLTTFEKE